MQLAAKIKKFEKAGADVSQSPYAPGLYYAKFENGAIVEFCKDNQAVIYGHDDASQETLRFFYPSVARTIVRAAELGVR